MNIIENMGKSITNYAKNKFIKTVAGPIDEMVDQNITDITTTIGSFIIRSIRGKFQRSITFSVGLSYNDRWMEEALYSILYKYNNIKASSRLKLNNPRKYDDNMYCKLDDGTHNLKYRNYDILLAIQTRTPSTTSRIAPVTEYTIITYDLSPEFVTQFEKDMILNRNSLLKIQKDSPFINVYQDGHEGDGYTYWDKMSPINKRRLNTLYLPSETKKTIIKTVNEFFASKDYYVKHGVAHNLKILLYGEPGNGKDSIAKMIASEWNRNLYYVSGGKDGRFIPNALTSNGDDNVRNPLFLISDIDKYPYLINEPDINITSSETKDEAIRQKQLFGNMINALDGILSGDDKIIIMTTNHIEKFSETFLRPGRVDLKLYIGCVTPEVFRKFTYDMYGKVLPKDIKLKDDKISVSTLQCDVMFLKLSYEDFIKKYVK